VLPHIREQAVERNPFRRRHRPDTPTQAKQVRFLEPLPHSPHEQTLSDHHSAVHAPEGVLATVSTTRDSGSSAGTEDPRVRAFLEFELSRFDNLKRVSSIAEHHIVMRDEKPIKRFYP